MLHNGGVNPRLSLRRRAEGFRALPPALLRDIPILHDALPALGCGVRVLANKAGRVTGTLWNRPHLLVVDMAPAASSTGLHLSRAQRWSPAASLPTDVIGPKAVCRAGLENSPLVLLKQFINVPND